MALADIYNGLKSSLNGLAARGAHTIDLHKAYEQYRMDAASNGKPELAWEDWLKENGHEHDETGLVKVNDKDQK